MTIVSTRTSLVPLVAVLALGALAGCSDSEKDDDAPKTTPREPAPVELAVDGTDEPLRIGVLMTLSSEPGQGAEQRLGAAGARVAEYRLDLGGADVQLEVVDDGGDVDRASAAVEDFLADDVIGIVAASSGDHLDGALAEAAESGVPVLLPYYRSEGAPSGVWMTGPSGPAVEQQLLAALETDGLGKPFVVSGDGVTADGIGSADAATLTGGNADGVMRRIRRAVEAGSVDSVVVAASAASQARVVSRLQGALPELPVLLTPEALSPVFASELIEAGGTAAGQFVTVGVDASDPTTLTSAPHAESVASYFAALRLAAGDEAVGDLLDAGAFADVASGADTASHDAVVALVRAAEAAGSTDPSEVAGALEGLTLDGGDGLAGAPLDFGSAEALAPESVVTLRATLQDPGVRPAAAPTEDAARLFWFAVPVDDTETG